MVSIFDVTKKLYVCSISKYVLTNLIFRKRYFSDDDVIHKWKYNAFCDPHVLSKEPMAK